MVQDDKQDYFEKDKGTSAKEFFKLQLLCSRLNLSPIGVSHLVTGLRKEVADLIGKNENTVGFDSEFFGREFDLIFTFQDPTPMFGKKQR